MNHYEVLGVDPKASEAEITKKHRNLSKYIHPDKTKADTTHLQAALNTAKDTLTDSVQRRKYDRELEASGRNSGGKENVLEAEALRQHVRELHLQLQNYEAQMQVCEAQKQQDKARMQHKDRQSARKEEETRRKYQAKIQNERRLSQQQIRRKEEELQQEKKRHETEQIAKCRCGICSSIVPSTDFWAAGCCGKLFCGECLRQRGKVSACPNESCRNPISVNGEGWTHNNKFIKGQIEEFAPRCTGCGKNVPKPDYEAHKLVCAQSCFKCNGNGAVQGPFGAVTIRCNVCIGNGTLRGEWTKCFMCSADTSLFCELCRGNKCLRGQWSPCFRCDCNGIVTQSSSSLGMDYQPTTEEDSHRNTHRTVIMHSITAMRKYEDKSFEELRLECYIARSHTELVPCDVCHGAKKLEGVWIKCMLCKAGRIQSPGWPEAPCISCSGKGSVIGKRW
jgi:DnaJ-class molecular chaperone